MSTQVDSFTQSLQTLILERECADRDGETLLIETLDLTRALHNDIEAAHERYRQGLVTLGTRGSSLALQTARRPTLIARPPWVAAARSEADQQSSIPEQLATEPLATPLAESKGTPRSASDATILNGDRAATGESDVSVADPGASHLAILGRWSNWHGYSR